MIKTESIEFVERGHIGKHVVTLVLDLLLAQPLFLCPRELARGQAVASEFMDLIQKCLLHWFYFLGISAKIKCEQSRHQGLNLGGANIIGEAHFFTDANEQTRAQVAAGLIY
jgi:hypothetical protein